MVGPAIPATALPRGLHLAGGGGGGACHNELGPPRARGTRVATRASTSQKGTIARLMGLVAASRDLHGGCLTRAAHHATAHQYLLRVTMICHQERRICVPTGPRRTVCGFCAGDGISNRGGGRGGRERKKKQNGRGCLRCRLARCRPLPGAPPPGPAVPDVAPAAAVAAAALYSSFPSRSVPRPAGQVTAAAAVPTVAGAPPLRLPAAVADGGRQAAGGAESPRPRRRGAAVGALSAACGRNAHRRRGAEGGLGGGGGGTGMTAVPCHPRRCGVQAVATGDGGATWQRRRPWASRRP